MSVKTLGWIGSAAVGALALALLAPQQSPAQPSGAPAPKAEPRAAGRPAPKTAAHAAATPSGARAVLDQYCVGCHNASLKSGNIALDTIDLANVGKDAGPWEKVMGKLRSRAMPPAGVPRPDDATYDALAQAIDANLDRNAMANLNPGRTPALHRLNRVEYRNAIRDLLALDVDVAEMLPSDSASYGFDNIAGVLSISPTLMERYMSAAQKISSVAVGVSVLPTAETIRVPGDLVQDDRMAGLPFGTRGGAGIDYVFPQDGEYEVRLRLGRDQIDNIAGLAEQSQIEVSVDGEPVKTFTVGRAGARGRAGVNPPLGLVAVGVRVAGQDNGAVAGREPPAPTAAGATTPAVAPTPAPAVTQAAAATTPAAGAAAATPAPGRGGAAAAPVMAPNLGDANLVFRAPVKAGKRKLAVTFIKRTSAYVETALMPYTRVDSGLGGDTRYQPYILSVVISGPFNATGPGDTASRRKIFSCRPQARPGQSADALATAETQCAGDILKRLARQAYRRPVNDRDVATLLTFYQRGRNGGSFDAGMEMALRRLLVDPEFLFRVSRDPANIAPDTAYRIGDMELASRLSFFLWSSGPDEELLSLAERGRLKNPTVLQQQVRRMLADRRSEALVSNFAGQWLYLRNVPSLAPDNKLYPDFDDSLRQAMRRETELFVESIIREDRSVLDLLSANYSFVNERLAKHYGVPNVYGPDFRRVTFTDPNRGGLLGQAAILAATSEPTRTSPVRRGKWVLENLLGAPPPPPPPNVPGLAEPTAGTTRILSMREQMEEHRRNPACASCHRVMDPIGFSLENFDALGRWRNNNPWVLTVEDEKWRPNAADGPIDPSGVLPNGMTFNGPAGLKQALLAHPEEFVSTMTEKLMIYALGRGIEDHDRPFIRRITREAAAKDNRFSAVITGIVTSPQFLMRMSEPAPNALPTTRVAASPASPGQLNR